MGPGANSLGASREDRVRVQVPYLIERDRCITVAKVVSDLTPYTVRKTVRHPESETSRVLEVDHLDARLNARVGHRGGVLRLRADPPSGICCGSSKVRHGRNCSLDRVIQRGRSESKGGSDANPGENRSENDQYEHLTVSLYPMHHGRSTSILSEANCSAAIIEGYPEGPLLVGLLGSSPRGHPGDCKCRQGPKLFPNRTHRQDFSASPRGTPQENAD
jgi:hypothetical protein